MNRAKEPAIARLSFRVLPAHRKAFEAAYEAVLAPALGRQGLEALPQAGRLVPEDVFYRLFALEILRAVQAALARDGAWQAALARVRPMLAPVDGYRFCLYEGPAGAGRRVAGAAGRRVRMGAGRGHWRTFDTTDGLGSGHVGSILQDRKGYLWFGAWGGGASRYDGEQFEVFRAKEGLAGNVVLSMIEDRDGNLWFGTRGGASRYDGRNWSSILRRRMGWRRGISGPLDRTGMGRCGSGPMAGARAGLTGRPFRH